MAGASQSGRIAQIDQLVLQYSATAYFPVAPHVTVTGRFWGSDSVPLSSSIYSDPARVAAALGTNCSAAGDAEAVQDCTALKARLADYIAASNSYGTALPVGGAYSLRGYREMRYRAAHTQLLGVEARWVFSKDLDLPYFGKTGPDLELSPFVELGAANDRLSHLYTALRPDFGIGLKVLLAELPLRLETAWGQEGWAWYFTVGHAW